MRVITVSDELSPKQFEGLAMMIGQITDAMVDGFYGSFEVKFDNGNLLPHFPAKESRELSKSYKRAEIKVLQNTI